MSLALLEDGGVVVRRRVLGDSHADLELLSC
jgi:hypothetical protein